jgi:hypothetical protein
MGLLFFLIAIIIASGLSWFYYPALMDVVKLERENARIAALTKQTKRDMDNLARRQRREGDGW